MMISEEPDEDADNLDDETLLREYLGADKKTSGETGVAILPDWPPRAGRDAEVTVDSETSAWFKQHHGDWRRAVRQVLRAWVSAQEQDGRREH